MMSETKCKSIECNEETKSITGALLEQPIVVEGKRQRKKTERLSENISKAQEEESRSKEIVIPIGKGTALGDIEYVQYHINRTKADDMKLLHRILFGRQGTVSLC